MDTIMLPAPKMEVTSLLLSLKDRLLSFQESGEKPSHEEFAHMVTLIDKMVVALDVVEFQNELFAEVVNEAQQRALKHSNVKGSA